MGQAEGNAKRNGMWTPARLPGVGQAQGIAAAEQGVVEGGGVQKGRLKGVPASYQTGTASTGMGTSARNIVSDSSSFVQGVSDRESEPHPSRGRLSPGESAGARLTVSPSMKTPQESPVPIQGGGYPVPSQSGRMAPFGAGVQESHAF
jgi:hypothetical protein